MISVAIKRNKTCFYLEKCKNVTTIKTQHISKQENERLCTHCTSKVKIPENG